MSLAKSLFSVVVSLASAWILHIFYCMFTHRRWFNGLPQPPHSFLWGHLKVMGEAASTMPPNTHPQAYLTAIAKKYNLKGIFYLDLWPIADSQVVLTDPALMDQVTVTKSLAMHPLANEFLEPIVGKDVVATSNGAIWKKTHNAMSPAFSWSHIRNLTNLVIDETMLFCKTLDDLAETGEIFSMEETASRLVFDIIARIVFNHPLHAQTKGSQYLDDLRGMVHLAEAQLSWNPVVKFKAFFQRRVILRRLDVSIVAKIKERLSLLVREQIIPSRKDPFSILDLMLREHLQNNKFKESGVRETTLKSEYLDLLVTNVKGLLLGGSGTTTDTLCFIYMLLSKAPKVAQKLREEHSNMFHGELTETLNILRDTPQKLDQLEYTAAVIKEALRLFPIGFGVREAGAGATIDYSGKTHPIDNHLVVVATAHTLHYDPLFYSSPANFIPERFVDPANVIPRSYFRTFGRGPRACLGQNLAQDELKVILLMTLRYYDFECADLKPNPAPRTNFTELDTIFGDIVFQELGLEAKPRGGMMMKIKKRN